MQSAAIQMGGRALPGKEKSDMWLALRATEEYSMLYVYLCRFSRDGCS